MKENDKEDEKDLFIKENQKSENFSESSELLEILEEDKDSDDNDSETDENKIPRILTTYKIKDYLMMIFLLLSSSVNFSILYIPFVTFGISYIFLLLKYNNHLNSVKRKIEIISLIYSFLLYFYLI